MSDNKWEQILADNGNEIRSYLSTPEFMELSKLNKFIRLKLKPKLFENILLSSRSNRYIIEELRKFNIDIDKHNTCFYQAPLDIVIPLLSRSVSQFAPYIKGINTKIVANHYELLEFSHLFPHLTSLTVSCFYLSLSALKTVLRNLKHLQILKVEHTHFIQYGGISNPITPITLPNNLKHIKWNFVTACHSSLDEDPQIYNFNYNHKLSNISEYLFKPAYFPNLKTLSSITLPVEFCLELLALNPQLVTLNFNTRDFNSYRILEKIQNIKKLKFLFNSHELNLNAIDLSFPNLTYLHISIHTIDSWSFFEKVALSSPKLAEFKIFFSRLSGPPPIFELISKIPSLRKLRIESKNSENIDFDNFIPHTNLKLLELWSNLDINATLTKLAQCPNLQTVCFGREKFYTIYLLSLNLQRTPSPWTYIKSNEFVKYHRLLK